MMTRQPSATRAVARARPSPAEAPVTSAVGMGLLLGQVNPLLKLKSSLSQATIPGMVAMAVLSVSEVAARSGFAPSTLRFYEREGLISATRTVGNQRRYERSVLRRLAFSRAACNVGLTLDEVRAELARLPSERTPTTADWHRISRNWRERLNERITAIEALRDRLDSCIGCGCLSLKICALYNPEDRLGAQARPPGAALLPALLRRPVGAEGSTRE